MHELVDIVPFVNRKDRRLDSVIPLQLQHRKVIIIMQRVDNLAKLHWHFDTIIVKGLHRFELRCIREGEVDLKNGTYTIWQCIDDERKLSVLRIRVEFQLFDSNFAQILTLLDVMYMFHFLPNEKAFDCHLFKGNLDLLK